MPLQKPTPTEKLAFYASLWRVADPDLDKGAFSSLNTSEAMSWIMAIGHVNEIDPRIKQSREQQRQYDVAIENLRVALWDIQRFEYLFPLIPYSKRPNFDISSLESWPVWKIPHTNVRDPWTQMENAQEKWERMSSYVVTQFHLMAFTQRDIAEKYFMTPPQGVLGNWIGVKKIMSQAGLDITEAGVWIPFQVYFFNDIILIMEILDVKRLPWPAPGSGILNKLLDHQENRSGGYQGGNYHPLGFELPDTISQAALIWPPALQTPKAPLVVVRYSYTQGRPAGGSDFMVHLESRLQELSPPGTSADDVRVQLESHILAAQQTPPEHLLMMARLLSFNADLINQKWADDQQSKISQAARKETRISFFVPCLRPRFTSVSSMLFYYGQNLTKRRAVEEIETGLTPKKYLLCVRCRQETERAICRICKAVFYCGPDCARRYWPQHKLVCQTSIQILYAPSSLPPGTLYIPVRTYTHWVADFGFANAQEAIEFGNPSLGECAVNQYGTDRFMCRILWAGEPEHLDERLWQTAVLFDRRRSVIVRFGPKETERAQKRGIVIPFHETGYRKLGEVIQRYEAHDQSMYFWVRRVGDCIEVK
ncbi:Ankyrin repeat and mynd domain-containing protein 2-like [Mycena venus]|uniref:Ankyrin repeat and mynd domain-containing protein 2-like n=1 Tax=Mycena venus TaxID=2733690 RepID=A0A8H6XNN8_9AGAR|nr:Ankyrin repeat and mynd domain-containing protein 2-like [Mycena venus]